MGMHAEATRHRLDRFVVVVVVVLFVLFLIFFYIGIYSFKDLLEVMFFVKFFSRKGFSFFFITFSLLARPQNNNNNT